MSVIIADENMPALELFQAHGEVQALPGRNLCAQDLERADTLLVRSVTQVNEALLANTPVKFVGSATIGTDHLALDWLAEQDIHTVHAPGCNAMAVAEYVLQAVISWLVDYQKAPEDCCITVVGVGNVGRRVVQLCEALGLTVYLVDPMRAQAELQTQWHTLDEVLAADIITCHVPLTHEGQHATHHLFNQQRLQQLHGQQLLINTSRGPVVDNTALLQRLQQDNPPSVVLDVWETEPIVNPDLFALVRAGTPHIAGYSAEGKWRGTWMLYEAWCQWRGIEKSVASMPVLAPQRKWANPVKELAQILTILCEQYNIQRDHQRLAASLSEKDTALAFDQLRRNYLERYELAGLVCQTTVDARWHPLFSLLGVVVAE